MSHPSSRFDKTSGFPTFSFDEFLLRRGLAPSPGFDEWNIFSVPDECVPLSQFRGRYLPAKDRAHTAGRPGSGLRVGRPATVGVDRPATVALTAPEAFTRPRFQRPSTTAADRGRKSPARKSEPASSNLKPLKECVLGEPDEASVVGSLKRSAFKGKMFSLSKGTDSLPNDSMFKMYENEYDLHAFSKLSVPTPIESVDEGSDIIPTMNKPLQVHNRIMGWKLSSPARRGPVSATACRVKRSEPLTLQSMGFRESVSEGGRVSAVEDRVSARQIDALQKILRFVVYY